MRKLIVLILMVISMFGVSGCSGNPTAALGTIAAGIWIYQQLKSEIKGNDNNDNNNNPINENTVQVKLEKSDANSFWLSLESGSVNSQVKDFQFVLQPSVPSALNLSADALVITGNEFFGNYKDQLKVTMKMVTDSQYGPNPVVIISTDKGQDSMVPSLSNPKGSIIKYKLGIKFKTTMQFSFVTIDNNLKNPNWFQTPTKSYITINPINSNLLDLTQ